MPVSASMDGCCAPRERIMGAPGIGHEVWIWTVWPGAHEEVLAREVHLELVQNRWNPQSQPKGGRGRGI